MFCHKVLKRFRIMHLVRSLNKVCYKHDLIKKLCKDKVVLHIGAADSPYHKEKAERGDLLHQKIEEVSKKVIGIDVDKNAISFLKKLGIKIYYGDIVENKYAIDLTKYNFDIILFPDVIEHLDCPKKALLNIKKLMKRKTRLILTTPNAHCKNTLIDIIRGNERVHDDHKFWPSRKTIKVLLEKNGFKIIKMFLCRTGERKKYSPLSKFLGEILFRIRPDLMPTIFIIAKLEG